MAAKSNEGVTANRKLLGRVGITPQARSPSGNAVTATSVPSTSADPGAAGVCVRAPHLALT